MQKRTQRRDTNVIAHEMVERIAAGEPLRTSDGKDPLAVLLGRRGGLKGGPARAASLTAKERSTSAKKAALARWSVRNSEAQ
jgi:hypothetical protein